MRIAIAVALLLVAHVQAAEPTTRPTVLVELFTSEGCSSCPPADELLAKLAKPEAMDGIDIVPLALHVDYWDDLGWKDAYSSKDFTQRQRDYATALSARIYTPQMIVDGSREFVGSDARKARAAIAEAAKNAKGMIDLRLSSKQDVVRCELTVTGVAKESDIFLAVTEDDVHSDVARGENAGRQLTHVAVTQSLQKMGTLKVDEKSFTRSVDLKLDPTWRREKLKIVAFAQQSGVGPILAMRSVLVGR